MEPIMPTSIALKKTTTNNKNYDPAVDIIWFPDTNELILVTEDRGTVATLDDEEIDALHQILETHIQVRSRSRLPR